MFVSRIGQHPSTLLPLFVVLKAGVTQYSYTMNDPTVHVFDLFAGGGGFSTGAHQVDGVDVALAVDYWDKGLAIHSVNFPKTHHVHMSLGGSLEEFAKHIEGMVEVVVKEKDTWHLHGSPPCQSFSAANTNIYKGISDAKADAKRCNLTRWYLALVRRLNPPSWSMEQVPTALKFLQKHEQWLWTTEGVHVYPNVFGDEFGAATRRKRMYIGCGWKFPGNKTALSVGVAQDDGTFSFKTTPGGNYILEGSNKRKRNERRQSIHDALPQLAAELGRPPHDLAVRTSTDRYSAVSTGGLKNRPVRFDHGEGLRDLTMSNYAMLCKASQLTIYKRVDDTVYTFKPTNHRWVATDRALSVRERATLQGFPETYNLDVGTVVVAVADEMNGGERPREVKITTASVIKVIGNSVVPTIAYYVMSAVVESRS